MKKCQFYGKIRDAFISEFEARGLKPVQENGEMAISLFIVAISVEAAIFFVQCRANLIMRN